MLISTAYAQAAGPAAAPFDFISLMPLVLIFVVFYFLLIRPQQQKVKAHRAMIDSVKKGDQVVTGGGLYGRVTRVEADNTVMVEIAPNVQVKVAKHTISDLVNKPVAPPPANANATPAAGGFLSKLFKK
ncbi:MAG: preprotein translocase subunit YajC [Geminicoccaceae bacterium]